jgi:hypothetical protein
MGISVPSRISIGSNPVMTMGTRCLSLMGPYSLYPITAQTWPGPEETLNAIS